LSRCADYGDQFSTCALHWILSFALIPLTTISLSIEELGYMTGECDSVLK